MDVWKLPKSVKVNGKEYRIRSDYRAVLDILCAINDPDIVAGMSEEEKNLEIYTTILAIFYEDFDNLPTEDWEEALKAAKEFIDCGFKGDKKKPQLMDWKKDAKILIPAINKVAHEDIRDKEYLSISASDDSTYNAGCFYFRPVDVPVMFRNIDYPIQYIPPVLSALSFL